MLKIAEMASQREFFQSALSLVPLLAIVGQGPVVRCAAVMLSSAHASTARSGAHCPFNYISPQQGKLTKPQCPMHYQAANKRPQSELRCNCCPQESPSSSSEGSGIRFLLPHRPTSDTLRSETKLFVTNVLQLPMITLAPPDPPPRSHPDVSL
jgi:hypothetical protein